MGEPGGDIRKAGTQIWEEERRKYCVGCMFLAWVWVPPCARASSKTVWIRTAVQRWPNGTRCASLCFVKQRLRQGPQGGWSQTYDIHINYMCKRNMIIWFVFFPYLLTAQRNSSNHPGLTCSLHFFAQERCLYSVQEAICPSVFGQFENTNNY